MNIMNLANFIIHLRWHYQTGVLSAAYLLALIYKPQADWTTYLLQFINIHLLLFGGATAFNSYWDRDEGPVGGLKQPPPIREWMRWAALGLMGLGLLWALKVGVYFVLLYLFSLFLFWGYSSPVIRWKGRPGESIAVIALSTGANSFLMGCLAAGNTSLGAAEYTAAIGVGLMLVSLYPTSQIFQQETDRSRGDITFAIRYGIRGVRRFFVLAYVSGLIFLAGSLYMIDRTLALVFSILSIMVASGIYYQLSNLKGHSGEYNRVMYMKYGTSISFIAFILITWTLVYYFNV